MSPRTQAARPRPDFSGAWRLLPEPGAPPRPPALVAEPDLTIVQTADTLTTTEPGARGSTVTMVYKLDGTPTRLVVNRTDIVTRAAWEGETLVTTVTGPSADWRDVWKLVDGRLVITTTTPGRAITGTRAYERVRTRPVPGSWFPVPGSRFLVPGSWFLVPGSWFLVPGSRFLVPGSWFGASRFVEQLDDLALQRQVLRAADLRVADGALEVIRGVRPARMPPASRRIHGADGRS